MATSASTSAAKSGGTERTSRVAALAPHRAKLRRGGGTRDGVDEVTARMQSITGY